MRTNADLRDIYPSLSGVLTDGNGTTFNLDGHCIPSGQPTFKAGTSPTGTFAVGGAVISSVGFELMNGSGAFDSVVWKRSKVSFTLTCGQTAVNMGEYYVVSHSESGGNISVMAFDALKLLDSYEMHELNLTYPTTAGAVVSAIATFGGLTASGLRTPNVSITEEIDDRMTMRQCLSYIAQIAGQYVQAKGNVLQFGWYDLSGPWSDGNTFGHDWGTQDVSVTGIRVSDHENTTVEDRGADGYRIEISGNPLINATNASAIADVIWAACSGISFRAGSAEILASPSFEAGDVVSVNTPDETGVVLILSNITYTPDVSMSVTSDADAQDGDLDLYKSPYIKTSDAQKTVDDGIDNALSDPSSALSQAIAAGGGGGGGGEWVLITSTIALFSRYSSRGIDQPGAATGWMIDDTNGFQTINLVGEAKQIRLGAPAAGSAWGDKTWQQIPDWQGAYGKTFILPLYMDVKMGTAANAEVYSGIVEMPCKFYGSTQAAYETNAGRTIEMLYDPVHPPMVMAAPKQAALVGMVGIPFAPMRSAQGSSRAAVKYLNYTGRDPGDRDIRVFSFDWHVNPA